MFKWLLTAFVLAVPAFASASGFEAVTYPSCTFASRETSSRLILGLECGAADYGDCSYASYSPGDVLSLTCDRFFLSRLSATGSEETSSGTVLSGVSAYRKPLDSVSLPLLTASGGLRILSTPLGDVSVDLDAFGKLLVSLVSFYLGIRFVLFLIRRAWYLFV